MRLSLCMIVRDNRSILEECLTSIRPWVDEMIVVDTGSTDGTPELAASLGARVSHFPWIDDFAAARNASVAEARGEWLFWMDSDDVIDDASGRKLRGLADGEHDPKIFGYVMQVHCPGADGKTAGDVTVVDHIKMFRNRPDIRFEGRIHEQILPSLRRAGGEVAWADVYVTHIHGSVTPEARARKQARDLRILELDFAERGEHPFVLFNLGMTYADMNRPQEAAGFLERSIRAAEPHESHLPKAFALLVACRSQTGDWTGADEACRKGRTRFPDDEELRFRAAVVAGQLGRTEEAIGIYRQLLNASSSTERRFSSRDVGLCGHKARHNLAILHSERRDWAQAELQWRLALEEAPHFQPALKSLGQALVEQRKRTTARETARAWTDDLSTRCSGIHLQAQLAEADGDPHRAVALLQEAQKLEPHRTELLEMLSRLLFAAERFTEAESALVALAELWPQDASVAHNLGAVYMALNRKSEAVVALQRSLKLRPQAAATRELLTHATG